MTAFPRNDLLEFADLETVRSEQDTLLKNHVQYCADHSPFYKERLTGLEFENLSLKDLPITDKMEVSIRNSEFVAVNPQQVADIVFSSGTTGWPTRIMYSHGDLQRLRGSLIFRGLSPLARLPSETAMEQWRGMGR